MSKWTTENIPDLSGKIAVVTGANSGLGLETTRALAAKGAHVVMAIRNLEKGNKALVEIKATLPAASLELLRLDLASLTSIRDFAASYQKTYDRLDLLFNNAGIMDIPRMETADGFEMQFGSNHLGHFALTGLLLPPLLGTTASRVVTTSSIAMRSGKIKFDDLNHTISYQPWQAYCQSKLSNLLFTFELQRRLSAANTTTISVAAHPGYAQTNLQMTSVNLSGSTLKKFFYTYIGPFVAQNAYMGALPQLYAATMENIRGGELIGPDGFMGLHGYPRIEVEAQKKDEKEITRRLWDISVELTGVDFAVLEKVAGFTLPMGKSNN